MPELIDKILRQKEAKKLYESFNVDLDNRFLKDPNIEMLKEENLSVFTTLSRSIDTFSLNLIYKSLRLAISSKKIDYFEAELDRTKGRLIATFLYNQIRSNRKEFDEKVSDLSKQIFKNKFLKEAKSEFDKNLKQFDSLLSSILNNVASANKSSEMNYDAIQEISTRNKAAGDNLMIVYSITWISFLVKLESIIALQNNLLANLYQVASFSASEKTESAGKGAIIMSRMLNSKSLQPITQMNQMSNDVELMTKTVPDLILKEKGLTESFAVGALTFTLALGAVYMVVNVIRLMYFAVHELLNTLLDYADDVETSLKVNAHLIEDVAPEAASKQRALAQMVGNAKNWVYDRITFDSPDAVPQTRKLVGQMKSALEDDLKTRKAEMTNSVSMNTSSSFIM